jgi:hypothetical protein
VNIRPSLLLSTLLLASAAWAIDIRVNDSRENNFYMDALIWVLEKSEADYRLIHTNHLMSSQVRKVSLVQKGEIDVMYAGTTIELESVLKPIRYPITRGLIGRRIFIINKKYRTEFAQIEGVEDLRKYSGVLSYGWADKEIYEAAGLMQIERLYVDIFSNLNNGSRYYFSRGILEAYSELIDKKETMPNLMVEEGLLLKYKLAIFFFINPKNKELENILNTGFKKSYEDGSYKDFLYSHPLIKDSFEKANLDERLIIEIPNPYFPKVSDSIPSQYWYDD